MQVVLNARSSAFYIHWAFDSVPLLMADCAFDSFCTISRCPFLRFLAIK